MASRPSTSSLPLLVILGLLVSACGSDPDAPGPVRILSFTAEPAEVPEPGATTTLRWSTANAVSVRLEQEGVALLSRAPAEGSLEVAIDAPTHFELIVRRGKASARESLEVTIASPALAIGSFGGPEVVGANEVGLARVQLAWSGVAGASELVLESDTLAPISLDSSQPDGSLEVEIEADTVFILVARAGEEEVRREHAVRVVALPTIHALETDRSWLGVGESFEVSWEVAGAASVQLWMDGLQVGEEELDPAQGSQRLTAMIDTEVELVASNEAGGEVRRAIEIKVAAPALTFFHPEVGAWLDRRHELSWEALGASELTLRLEGEESPLLALDDYLEIQTSTFGWEPTFVGPFELLLEATNASGIATASWVSFVAAGPRIVRFEAEPAAITIGEATTIHWEALPDPDGEAPALRLEDDRGETYEVEENQGELELVLSELGTWQFELEASTSSPESNPAVAQLEVRVFGAPAATLEVDPTHFDDRVDEDVVFTWTSENADSLVLYEIPPSGTPLVLLEVPEAQRHEGSLRFVPTNDSSYRLVATNGAGLEATAEAALSLAPPRVDDFVAEPLQLVAGEPLTLSWTTALAHEVSLSIAEGPFVLEEIPEPFLDLAEEGGSRLDLLTFCDEGVFCERLDFPGGFTFPFEGTQRAAARVYQNGVISFDAETPAPSSAGNTRLPTPDPAKRFVHLAPFWDALEWDPARSPAGDVRYLLREDPAGDSLVIQWSDVGFAEEDPGRRSSLNFQVVLWASGDFEFRYGTMEAGEAPAAWADGESATIGFQYPSLEAHGLIRFERDLPFRGNLRGRSFRFRRAPSFATSGSFTYFPYAADAQHEVTLWARRNAAQDGRTISVTVAPGPTAEINERPMAPVPTHETFRVGWISSDATALEIVDPSGEVVCEAASQPEVNEGFCELEIESEGIHRYWVQVTGLRGNTVSRAFDIGAYDPFGIDLFEADPPLVEHGESTTLRWATTNAAEILLLEEGTPVMSWSGTPSENSHFVPKLDEHTTFTLRVINSLGMEVEESITVEMWAVRIGITPSATRVTPGQKITLDVESSTVGGGDPPILFGAIPMVEVTEPSAAYRDLSTVEGATSMTVNALTGAEIPFPTGFEFPFYGVARKSVKAFPFGYLTFSTGFVFGLGVNAPLPGESTVANIHLAPFWDQLVPAPGGEVWVGSLDEDHFAIQWKSFMLQIGGTTAAPHDLNFQVVLHRSGAFDFRYGTMAPQEPPTLSPSCFPGTCENEVRGSSATIGYQQPDGDLGYTHHFGGATNGEENLPFDGGLANRTFRYVPIQGSASLEIMPTRSTTYSFCALSGTIPVCKHVEIEVDFGIESFEASASKIDFGDDATLSWETVGGGELHIRAGSDPTPIFTTSDPAQVAKGTLRVEPKSHTTYTLELKAPGNRALATARVEVHRIDVRLTANPTSSFPGQPVTLSWEVTSLDPNVDPIIVRPMEERFDAPFAALDISEDPDAITVIGTNVSGAIPLHEFTGGFTFDFFGQEMSAVRVSSEGYLSFDLEGATAVMAANQPIPNDAPDARQIHLAPFWDDLHTRVQGRVFAKAIDANTYVIQWSHMSMNAGSSNGNEGDLNFMVVLHRNGDFEYRYGDMLPPPTPSPIHCFPSSCLNESNGSSATIGYQDRTGSVGALLHFGGTDRFPGQEPVEGGLGDRSWRFIRTSGAGSTQFHPIDTTVYEICAIEGLTQDISCSDPVEVRVDWGITSFEVSPAAVVRGDPVTVRWEVVGLDELQLWANAEVLEAFVGDDIPATHTLQLVPDVNTLYTLVGLSVGRTVSEHVRIEIRGLHLDVDAPQGRLFPGDAVELKWELIQLEPGAFASTVPMVEVPAGAGQPGAFEDIRGLPDAVAHDPSHDDNGSAIIELPFDFPYFGERYDELQVYVDGVITFDVTNFGLLAINTPIPTEDARWRIHLAPFWDDLIARGEGPDRSRFWTYEKDEDTFIIQYGGFDRAVGSSDQLRYDLNFQVVLHADGSFEYRYGRMAPPPQPFSDPGCFPSTCEAEANGSSATIGYQLVRARAGSTLHYGSGEPGASAPMPGGLSHRTFRFEPSKTGSIPLVVGSTEERRICATVGTFLECTTVTIRPVADPGSLMITELMIDPDGGEEEQWFEVRNLSNEVIDLEGFVISTDTGSHRIDRSLPVAPGAYLSFAPGAAAGFTPDYAYGSDLRLNRSVDTLEIAAGTSTIASVSWGVSWFVPAGETLFLDPSFHALGQVSNDDFGRWCRGSAQGTPGAKSEGCVHPDYDVDLASSLPFIDISTIGTRLQAVEGDRSGAMIPITGFSMPFFDEVVDTVWAGTNGWVSFARSSPGGFAVMNAPEELPRAAGAAPAGPLVAAFFDSLVCNSQEVDCSFTYQHGVFDGEEMLILQWTGYRRSPTLLSTIPIRMTFQVQLWIDGTIVIAFDEMRSTEPSWSASARHVRGSEAWIGLEGGPASFFSAHLRSETDLNRRTFHFWRK